MNSSKNNKCHKTSRAARAAEATASVIRKGSRCSVCIPISVVCPCGKTFSCLSSRLYTTCKSCAVDHKKSTGKWPVIEDVSSYPDSVKSTSPPRIEVASNSVLRPKERLVCVELNPGPDKGKQKAPKGQRREHRIKKIFGKNDPMSHVLTRGYVATLSDPFNYPGIPLGWGTLQPTTVGKCYFRTTHTMSTGNACLMVAAFPNAKNLIALAESATPGIAFMNTGAGTSAANQSGTTSNFTAGRCISIGLRVTPLQALTSAQTVIYSGSVPMAFEDVGTITGTDLINTPSAIQTLGTVGATACGRPIDPTSFTFYDSVVDGNGFLTDYANESNATDLFPFSIPFLVITGIQDSSSLTVEVVMNYEGLTAVKHNSLPIVQGTREPSLAGVFPSIEGMWEKVSGFLPPVSSITGASSNFLSSAGSAAGKVLGGGFASYLGAGMVSAAQRGVSYLTSGPALPLLM